ncbi:RNA polymerase subunit sigma-24 [Brumimicrobium salinarum]|uniref:RNA polymerase subunit sigma-24 n=1 Tax=Brumimicrobium salinarum TaxID=2058658 RepID=A0A2I0R0K7_9FLAO|nr:sigma-70 family RNA polymerase sigma factor [Brumimicrobium salinarum]PKR80118.1 RNA polymerase subunit sigma-24 [Brumimicrobium salinarum]
MRIRRKEIAKKTDDELIQLYRQTSNEDFIGELYRRYGHLVMGTCMNYLKNKTTAEDFVMEIFMDLGTKLKKHEIKYFKSWLFILTKNKCLMLLRKKQQHHLPIAEEIIEDSNEVEEKELQEIKLTLLEKAIAELMPPQDQIIKLFYLEKKTYKEVSELLNITIKKVKSGVQNGKRNLKIKLKENGLFKYTQ